MKPCKAQGDYKNLFVNHVPSSSTSVSPRDIETINNHIVVTGLLSPKSGDIPGINNPSNISRIFLDDYMTGVMNFKKVYLIGSLDMPNISKDYSYIVNEVKYDGSGYVVCGNIRVKTVSTSFSDAFILRVDLAGNCLWFKRYPIQGSNTVCFNSIEPIISGSSLKGYVACGYRLDPIGGKRAIITRTDSLGNFPTSVLQVNEVPISGKYPTSEFKKVIRYDKDEYALVGTCGLLKDSCGRMVQSNILFSMYNVNTLLLRNKDIGTGVHTISDRQSDEGVSLVKCDSGLVILSKYHYSGSMPCAGLPDYFGNLIHINPVIPSNVLTWQIMRSVKYTIDPNTYREIPKDLLFDPSSGAAMHVWVYGDYSSNSGYLIKVNMSIPSSAILPMGINNNPGGTQMECKTIDFNSSGKVVGLSNLFQKKFSLIEITNSSSPACKSDSLHEQYFLDTLSWYNLHVDSLVMNVLLLPHKAFDVTVTDTFACDTVSSKSTGHLVEEQRHADISIYPNPVQSNAMLDIRVSEPHEMTAVMTDMTGHVILRVADSRKLLQGINRFTIDMNTFRTGVYLCIMYIDGKRSMLKVMKE